MKKLKNELLENALILFVFTKTDQLTTNIWPYVEKAQVKLKYMNSFLFASQFKILNKTCDKIPSWLPC